MRAHISRGLFYGGYEPHDMPGAYIVTRNRVIDAQGATPPGQIHWSGPAEWIVSRDGVPAGHTALWLGTRQATRPFVVYVEDEMTPESELFDAGYRRGWKAKRKPVIPRGAAEATVEGIMQGWRDACNERVKIKR